MRWHIFKNPYKKGSIPLESIRFEPNQMYIELKAQRYGNITIMSDTDLEEWSKQHEKISG